MRRGGPWQAASSKQQRQRQATRSEKREAQVAGRASSYRQHQPVFLQALHHHSAIISSQQPDYTHLQSERGLSIAGMYIKQTASNTYGGRPKSSSVSSERPRHCRDMRAVMSRARCEFMCTAERGSSKTYPSTEVRHRSLGSLRRGNDGNMDKMMKKVMEKVAK